VAQPNDYLQFSYDYGVTWDARASSQPWAGVAMSSDGMKIYAIAAGIYSSSDGGYL
jgi:hypothetical protein